MKTLRPPCKLSLIRGNYKKGFYGYNLDDGVYFYNPDKDLFEKVKQGYMGLCKYVEDGRYLQGLLDQDYYCYDLKENKFVSQTRLTPLDSPGMRIWSLSAGPDSKVYTGSYPSYSSGPTNAMSVLDPQTGNIEVYTDLAPRCLASNKELVFGSGKNEFFIFDPKLRKKIFQTKNSFVSMAGLPDGCVGATDGKIFYVFDPKTNKFIFKKDLEVGDINTIILGSDGNIYGIGSVVFRLNSQKKWAVELLCKKGGKFLAEDRVGNFYFARVGTIFRLTIKDHGNKKQ